MFATRSLLILTASVVASGGGVAAQSLTSDCAFDELSGPVAVVETERARYEDRGGQRLASEAAPRRHDEFDAACNYTSRILYDHSEVHWEYWPDEQGRGQRLRTWTVDRADAPPSPPPAAPPGGRPAVANADRGTRIEMELSADSSEIYEREITNGLLRKDWVHTLDNDGRVVQSVMLNVDGEPDYQISHDYDGAETVSTYERLATSRRASTSFRRERTVNEATDERGNWTRRMVYEWDDQAESWVPKERLTRTITYR